MADGQHHVLPEGEQLLVVLVTLFQQHLIPVSLVEVTVQHPEEQDGKQKGGKPE